MRSTLEVGLEIMVMWRSQNFNDRGLQTRVDIVQMRLAEGMSLTSILKSHIATRVAVCGKFLEHSIAPRGCHCGCAR
jgi:hypothetical protein